MVALTSLVIRLPRTLTLTATAPAPTLTARERMIADDSARTPREPAPATVDPLIRASVQLVITLAESATPTPTPPAATPKERASMVELFFARTVIAPPDWTTEPESTSARVKPVIVLAERETRTPTVEAAATPPDSAMMFESEIAVMPRVVPLVTFEPSILAVTVLTTTLAPIRAPTATAPDPATLMASERIID